MSELFIMTSEEAKTSSPRRSKSLQSEYADCSTERNICHENMPRERVERLAHQPRDSIVYVDTVEQVLR